VILDWFAGPGGWDVAATALGVDVLSEGAMPARALKEVAA
jgi:hypothetical protein